MRRWMVHSGWCGLIQISWIWKKKLNRCCTSSYRLFENCGKWISSWIAFEVKLWSVNKGAFVEWPADWQSIWRPLDQIPTSISIEFNSIELNVSLFRGESTIFPVFQNYPRFAWHFPHPNICCKLLLLLLILASSNPNMSRLEVAEFTRNKEACCDLR